MSRSTPWQDTKMTRFESLKRDVKCDVLVVGGGITGLTTAYLLMKAGKSVCLVERDVIGSGDTSFTTAHLTVVTDLRLSQLKEQFGFDKAKLVWQGGAAAINTVEKIVESENIECDFRRIPGILHASLISDQDEIELLQKDRQLATQMGFDATFVSQVAPSGNPGIRFADQAKFHPLRYLNGLAKAIREGRGLIFEHTETTDFTGSGGQVTANEQRIDAEYIVIATHVPVTGKSGMIDATLLQTKLAPYTSCAIGAHIPKGLLPEAIYWDTSNPYYYLRIDDGVSMDYAIFGGKDYKTGQVQDPEEHYVNLEAMLQKLIPAAKPGCRWQGQVIETHDGLPYIGETAENQFTATGFSGNGMTFGTLAAMMACDAAQSRQNPWAELFATNRKTLSSAWNFLKENFDFPYYLLRDRLAPSDGGTPEDVQQGEGRILKIEGQRAAVSRDSNGTLRCVSAICTHMGCVVRWNQAASTWDCPCHGSRFSVSGEVIAGPAETGLEAVVVPDEMPVT